MKSGTRNPIVSSVFIRVYRRSSAVQSISLKPSFVRITNIEFARALRGFSCRLLRSCDGTGIGTQLTRRSRKHENAKPLRQRDRINKMDRMRRRRRDPRPHSSILSCQSCYPVHVSSCLSSATRLNVAARCLNTCRPERSVKKGIDGLQLTKRSRRNASAKDTSSC